jgi:hypothetical protein
MNSSLYGHKTYGRITQSFGTKITRLVEPSTNAFTVLTYTQVATSTTAHILTIMKPLGKTTLSAAAATGQAVVNITANPGNYTGYGTADNNIATSDFCAVECDDGLIHHGTITLSTLEVTFAGNLPCACSAGNRFWFYGIETDVNPFDGLAHARYTLNASGTTVYGDTPGDAVVGWFGSNRREEPLLMVIDNGTAASTLERVTVAYSTKGGRSWNRITDDATFVPSLS